MNGVSASTSAGRADARQALPALATGPLRRPKARGTWLRRLARALPAAGLMLAMSLPAGAQALARQYPALPGRAAITSAQIAGRLGRAPAALAPAAAGLVMFGPESGDNSGTVSNAGDVNGDGFDDLIIGAAGADGPGNLRPNAGESHVVFGGAALTGPIDLATAAGVTLYGAGSNDRSATSVSGAGDVNGDGFDDLLIGAPEADGPSNARPGAGDSYLVFGGPGMPAALDLAALGSAGVTLFGAASDDHSGTSVGGAGDVNGDGLGDFIIGAPQSGYWVPGKSYLVYGSTSLPAAIDLAALGSRGVALIGASGSGEYDGSGRAVSGAGDVNGDGFDDLLISAPNSDFAYYGIGLYSKVYMVFGGPGLPSTINLATLGSGGVEMWYGGDWTAGPISVSDAGDVNGDGFDDALIGLPSEYTLFDPTDYKSGRSILVFGRASFPTTLVLDTLGAGGVTIEGAERLDYSGFSVSGAGDVNGDGFDDLLVGAPWADGPANSRDTAGESYLILGRPIMPPTVNLATTGVPLYGRNPGDNSGGSVSRAGDVNGDGYDDFLIGAMFADGPINARLDGGESYLVWGRSGAALTPDVLNAWQE